MNEDAKLSRQQLEATTAGELAAGSSLAADGALRERFLTFGRAVEQAGEAFDERALVERLAALASQQPPAVELGRATARNRPLWLLVLGGALAASALIAAVRIGWQWPAGEQIASSQPAVPSTNFPAPPVSPTTAAPQVKSTAETTAKLTATAAVLSWEDPLDHEIATAEQQLSALAGRPAALDGELTGVDQQLDSLSSDLNGGSL